MLNFISRGLQTKPGVHSSTSAPMNESTTIAATYSLVGARKIMDELAVAGSYTAFSMGDLSVIYRVSTLYESTYLEIQCLGGRKFGVVRTTQKRKR